MREGARTSPSTLPPEGVRPHAPLGVLLELPDDIPIAVSLLRHTRSVGRPRAPQSAPSLAVYVQGALRADREGGKRVTKRRLMRQSLRGGDEMDNSKQQHTNIPQTEQEWRTRLTPSSTRCCVTRERSSRSPARMRRRRSPVSTGAPDAGPHSSAQPRSTSRGPVGRVSGSRSSPGPSSCTTTGPSGASHGGHLCAMRRPSGACVLRRTAADGGSLLHELGLAGTRAGAARRVGDRPERPGSGFSQSVAHRPWTIAAEPGFLRSTHWSFGRRIERVADPLFEGEEAFLHMMGDQIRESKRRMPRKLVRLLSGLKARSSASTVTLFSMPVNLNGSS